MKEAVRPTWTEPGRCQGLLKARRDDEVSRCGFHRGPDIKNYVHKEAEYMTATAILSKFANFSANGVCIDADAFTKVFKS